MNTRLKQFLAAENITQASFADNINVVRASVSHVLSGRNNPSYEFIRSVMLRYPDLNIEWLMFGKGKMYKDNPQPEIVFPETEVQEQDLFTETFPESVAENCSEAEIPAIVESVKTIVNQRKVSKVIILFDDGTFQEM